MINATRLPVTVLLALRALVAHRLRTLLSALAVALGVAMITGAGVFRSGVEASWTAGENKFAFITEISNLVFGGAGLMMLAAAGFLIYNAFAMHVTQQRRQIGLLRSLGMARGQVLRLTLVEALGTGGLGTVLGLLGGPLVGHGLLAAMAYFGVEVGTGVVAPGGVALAVVMGLGISLLAALVPARRAAGVSPLAALRDEQATSSHPVVGVGARRRWNAKTRWGGVLLGVLWAYLALFPPGTWSGYHPPLDYILAGGLWGGWWVGLLLLTPFLLGGAVNLAQRGWRRSGGAIGRLLGDNLGRAPERLRLTALTFAVALLMMVTTGGFVAFGNDVLVRRLAAQALREQAWYVYPFSRAEGLGQLSGFQADAPGLDPAVIAEVERLAAGRTQVEPLYMAVVPEISSPFPGFPSLVTLSPERLARPGQFTLVAGSWETALPLLRTGCGLLVSPAVAGRHSVGVGGTLTVTGRSGPVTCTVAAIGAGGFAPMSFIGPGALAEFVAPGQTPDSLQLRPLPGADVLTLDADLSALVARYGEDKVYVSRPEDELRSITGTSDQLVAVFNGLLLLAVGAGALGSVNTTLVSILERRRELGLLRAVGATRRQVAWLVVGEAALVGLLGALLGILAGLGTSAIYALTYGGITFGLVDLPLWPAVGEIVWPALRNGLPGLVAAPLLAGVAAWLAARAVLRGPAIEMLQE